MFGITIGCQNHRDPLDFQKTGHRDFVTFAKSRQIIGFCYIHREL